MDPEAIGGYILLLCHQWRHGSVPDNDADLIKISKVKRKFLPQIRAKFRSIPDRLLINDKLEKERQYQIEYKLKRSEAGSKGAASRWQSHSEGIPEPMEKKRIKKNIIDFNKEKEKKENPSPKEEDLRLTFDQFRRAYPGSKRGLTPEWDDFIRKHGKRASQIVDLLLDSLSIQIEAKKRRERAGNFVPEWKNLKTYLYNSCWSEEIPPPDLTPKTKPYDKPHQMDTGDRAGRTSKADLLSFVQRRSHPESTNPGDHDPGSGD